MTRKDRRYGRNWPKTSDRAFAATRNRCTLCFWRKTEIAHHAYYGWGLGIAKLSIPDREIVGLQVFGVCRKCHGKCHRKANYLEHKNDWHDRNTLLMILRLRLSFLCVFLIVWFWWVPIVTGLVWRYPDLIYRAIYAVQAL